MYFLIPIVLLLPTLPLLLSFQLLILVITAYLLAVTVSPPPAP
jgi:hypothetical protein